MTGYGRADVPLAAGTLTVEARSLNHRHLDIAIRLPREFMAHEGRVRRIVQGEVRRGRVEVYASVSPQSAAVRRTVQVDRDLLRAALAMLRGVLADGDMDIEAPSAGHLLALPGILSVHESPVGDAAADALFLGVEKALQDLAAMRRKEGEELAVHLARRKEDVVQLLDAIGSRSQAAVESAMARLEARLRRLLADAGFDPARLAVEAAAHAERMSIEEEMLRLRSHLVQLEGLFSRDEPVGRRFDFLLTEMQREMTTLCSKGADEEMARAALDAKYALEQMREQVQNIE